MGWARLLWFEATRGTPFAVRLLWRRLGWRGLLGVLPALLRDPFRGLPRARTREERMSRHQLKPVLLLHQALTRRLGAERSLEVLRELIAESGSRFLQSILPRHSRERWRLELDSGAPGFRKRMGRFFNMRAEIVEDAAAPFAFDVSACHFASLVRKLGMPELGPLFCAVDDVYFGRPDVPIELTRTGTLAHGADRCDFRFRFKPLPSKATEPR